ncbi:MAG: hypothetical protein ACI9OD_001828 [Limisphaerales bacterium]|jgi:uncharacterized protein YbaR (Trm112 family)
MDESAWQLLCCPATHQQLRRMPGVELESLNKLIGAGEILAVSASKVTEPIEGALVRTDGNLAYPIRSGLPILLIDAGLILNPDE